MSLLRFTQDHILTRIDYNVSRSIPDDPVVTTSSEILDFACFEGAPCRYRAVANISGFYPRPGVPRLAALLGGVVIPLLMLIGAVVVAAQRGWVGVLGLWFAALILSGMMLQVPVKYFSGTSTANVNRQIAANAIYISDVDAGMSCLGMKPCLKNPYYAFARGVFPAEGVPRPLAIALGMALPGLLVIGSVALALWRRPRSIPA